MRMCWAAFALDAEESGWDDFITSRKSISSSPSLSVAELPATTSATTNEVLPTSPITPTSTSLPVNESPMWSSELTRFEPVWHKEIGAVPVAEPVIVDHDVDMDMDMDIDVIQQEVVVKDVIVSTPAEHHVASAATPIVTPSEQQEWIKTIDAQIEESQKQLEITTVQISRVEEVIKPAKRYIPTKITAYFPSSPILSVRTRGLDLSMPSGRIVDAESDEEKQQREILEELAKSLSSVSLRTRSRTQQVAKAKPPPIGIGMMMGFRSAKSETPSPKLRNDAELHTKITKRGVIGANRGGATKARGLVRRRHSTGRGDTICL